MEEKEFLDDPRKKEALKTAHAIDIIENVMIQTVTTQMSFTSLMSGLERGDYVIPGFQRMYRWSESQVEELAISLVRGMPIPPIYCYRNKEQQIVILDGQQRMMSLYFYYIGKFLKRKRNAFIDARVATSGEYGFKEYIEHCGLIEKQFKMLYKEENGEEIITDISYQKLNARMKRRIDFMPITLVEINVDSEKYKERTLHKIFANLNIGGTPLSSQELRNGIYGGKFYSMLYEINDTCKKWRLLYSGNKNGEVNKESKDVELLLQMCAFKYFVEQSGEDFIISNYKGKISTLLDDFSEKAIKFEKGQIKEYEEALLSFFDDLEDISGKNRNLALVSLFVVWDKMSVKPRISKDLCKRIIENHEYKSTINSGTASRSGIEKRLRSVYEQLSEQIG